MIALPRLLRNRRRVPETLATARLLLRAPCASDIDAIARLAGDWDVASMTARIPYPYTREDARQWLDGLATGEVVRAIEHGGALIGLTGYMPLGVGRAAEVGYWIGKPYWGRGFATEAAAALVGAAFSHGGFEALECCHFADNTASARVIEKLAFAATGEGMCWCEARRREVATVRYSLTRARWLRRRRAA